MLGRHGRAGHPHQPAKSTGQNQSRRSADQGARAVSISGNLTYEEGAESEQKAKKRLGDIPKPLKKALLWLADRTRRGRLNDVVDDVYAFASNRFFLGEVVEGIMNEMWCDCKVMKIIPPTQEEIEKDAAEEQQEEESKKAKDNDSSPTKGKKAKKSFSPPEHLFKYELLEVEPDNPDDNPVSTYLLKLQK